MARVVNANDFLIGKRCYWDDTPLSGQTVHLYKHSGGWKVRGFVDLQWLYVVCPKCGYQWALWKLGLSRTEEIEVNDLVAEA